MAPESTLLSVREAARRLGVHENTVRRYADRGLIRAVRLPSGVRRLDREQVAALAARLTEADRSTPSRSGGGAPESEAPASHAKAPALARLEDLAAPEVWKSAAELDEFLDLTYAQRDRDR